MREWYIYKNSKYMKYIHEGKLDINNETDLHNIHGILSDILNELKEVTKKLKYNKLIVRKAENSGEELEQTKTTNSNS